MSTEKETSVWIVEDESKYRDSVCSVLQTSEGVQCTEAFPDCESTLEWLEVMPEDQAPAVVLLDIKLPGISGVDGIGRIKAKIPGSQIVMLTNVDKADTIFDAFHAGASGYLLKSEPMDRIVAAIHEATRGGMLMPPGVASQVLGFFKGFGPKEDYGLTKTEKKVLGKMTDGLSQKQIADHFYRSETTINTHVSNIYKKLHVNSNIEAVAKAMRERLVTSDELLSDTKKAPEEDGG